MRSIAQPVEHVSMKVAPEGQWSLKGVRNLYLTRGLARELVSDDTHAEGNVNHEESKE